MEKDLYNWLEQQFYFRNHTKYKKYFKEWIQNLTEDQIDSERKQMIGMINQTKIKH